jgi:lipoprotein-releasing system ATP-binding protein
MSLLVDNLGKNYPTRGEPLSVLRGVNLHLQRGDALAVMGPSGSGKSTLLHILGTLDTPTTGTVLLDNVNPFTLSEPRLADFRNRRIGFVFQDHHLLPQCTVLENVLIPTLVGRDDRVAVRKYATELLERVGLSQRLEHRPAELSGGERQRVALARALIHKPMLLLADEPTGNLDRTTARNVGTMLLDLHREANTMLVVVTHSQELADTFPRVLLMEDGTLQPATRPEAVR